MFSSLRQGSPFYILEKNQVPTLKIGQVQNVSTPRAKYNTYTPGLTVGMAAETVVDLEVMVDGNKLEFKQVPSTGTIANFDSNNLVISDSKDAMVAEIDGRLQTSTQIIESTEYHKNAIESYKEMLKTLNPAYAKEESRDSAIESLTKQVDSIKNEFGDMKDNVNKILTLLTKGEK